MARRTIIVDIDGTLNKHSHKWLSYEPENDEANRRIMTEAEPNQDVIDLVNSLHFLGHIIIPMTGRPERFRNVTGRWLIKHRVMRSGILRMRLDDSKAHDADVKERHLDRLLAEGQDIWFAIEDRNSCVEMWRRRGILCLQPFEGNF